MWSWSKKQTGLILGTVLSAAFLCGCGSTVKTAEGMQCIERLEYENALAAFEEAQSEGEDSRLYNRGRGIAYLGLARYEEAIDSFEEALGESNGLVKDMDYDMNYYLASAFCKTGRFLEAKEVYDTILKLRPKEKDAYYYRGNAQIHLGYYEDALADFEQAIAMDPKNYDRIIDIYQILEGSGHKEAGKIYLQNALAAADNSMSVYDSGRMYYYLEEYQKAYIALEEAKSKGGAESYLYLGKAYEATGDYNYAASVYSNYLSKEGDDSAIYNQLGTCELKKKEYGKALASFESGLAMGDTAMHQSLAFNRIVALEYLGEFKHAYSLMEEYVKTYPEDEEAKRELRFLATR